MRHSQEKMSSRWQSGSRQRCPCNVRGLLYMGFRLKTRSSCAGKPGSNTIAYSIHTFVESVLYLWSCFRRAVLDLYLVFDRKRGRLERLHCVSGKRCNSRVYKGLLDGVFGGITSLAGARESALPPLALSTVCVFEGQEILQKIRSSHRDKDFYTA